MSEKLCACADLDWHSVDPTLTHHPACELGQKLAAKPGEPVPVTEAELQAHIKAEVRALNRPLTPTISLEFNGEHLHQGNLDRLSSLVHGKNLEGWAYVNIELKNVFVAAWPVLYADYGGDLLRRALEALVALAESKK